MVAPAWAHVALDPASPDPKDPSWFLLGGRVVCPIYRQGARYPLTDYRRAVDLADRYDVALASVDPERVLTLAG